MISILIPYFHCTNERLEIFKKCFSRLPIGDKRFEICIHEMGKESVIPNEIIQNTDKYLFSYFDNIFDKSWSWNRAVKKITTGDILCLLDADILVDESWIEQVSNCSIYSAGFGKVVYLSQKTTKHLYETNNILSETEEKKVRNITIPKGPKGAGVCVIIPRNSFYKVSGFPENFKGTYGGEDTAFFHKMKNVLGQWPNRLECTVYHLYHKHTTPIDYNIKQNAKIMRNWSQEQWKNHLKQKWGEDYKV